MPTTIVSVWVRWGDYVVEVRDVRPGEALWVGAPPLRLLRLSEDGTRVSLRDEHEVTLAGREPLRLSHAGLDYTLVRSELSDTLALAGGGGVPGFAGDCACLFVLLALLLGGSAQTPTASVKPPPVVSTSTDAPPFDVKAQRSPTLRIELDDASHAAPPTASGQMRCGDAEMGTPLRVADARARYGVRGPKDNADPHVKRPQAAEGHASVFALMDGELGFARPWPGSDAPSAAFGRADELGTDENNARGDYWAEAIADAHGEDGFGVEHVPFGASKAIAILPTSDGGGPRVVHSGLAVRGARKPSEVGRVLARQFGELVRCAHTSLPSEARDASLELDIDADGSIAVSAPHDALLACFSEGLAGASFSSGAQGPTHVTYPVHVFPATDRFTQRQKVDPPGELCHCGG
ncbi:MAG TPA: hypothetical protein VGI10_13655 [Polyangiaceae bacterium]|jgi:hypothetical protein